MASRVRNHITLNGDACLLQRFAKAVHLSANHRLASPKSSSRPLRRSTPGGEAFIYCNPAPLPPTGRGSAL